MCNIDRHRPFSASFLSANWHRPTAVGGAYTRSSGTFRFSSLKVIAC